MTTLPLKKSISRSSLRRSLPVVLLVLGLFALSSTVRAVNPPPDGGYPNQNTAEGDGALFNLAGGGGNTANGYQALWANTYGDANTANGFTALYHNTTGDYNTANGYFALFSNTYGYANTANGAYALYSNTTGGENTANGANALVSNTIGQGNTANGYDALVSNTTGNNNAANGVSALYSNTTGIGNTANGTKSLYRNTTGSNNTATGVGALLRNTAGNGNTAEGKGALGNNTGSFNVALGFNAGSNLTTGSDNIDIGHAGVAGESNTMRIGTVKQTATFITGIRGTTTASADAVPVVIDSAGQLGTVSSSQRFKDEIKPMDKSSEAILGLKPVTFHYKSDTQNTPQFGLIAEEVAKVNPNLVVRNEKNEIYTVRYEAVNAMLLNEFLKEHQRAVEEHQKVKEQGASIAQLKKQIEGLTATVQKVSDQLELNKTSQRVVANQ